MVLNLLDPHCHCSVLVPPQKLFPEDGSSVQPKMKFNWNYQRAGSEEKISSVGEAKIFSGTTHLNSS